MPITRATDPSHSPTPTPSPKPVRPSAKRPPTLVIASLIAVLCLGIAARCINLGVPKHFTFDEHHFVENARNFLNQRKDWNDHPPLGKLLIAVGIWVAGDDSIGWRLVPLLFGFGLLGMAYLLGRTAFGNRTAGALAAGFLSIDGFLISYSRAALLDGLLVFFMVAAAVMPLRGTKSWHWLTAGMLIGCATSIKFLGIVMLAPMAGVVLARRPTFSRAIPTLALVGLAAAIVYVAQFSFGLWLSGEPSGLTEVWHRSRALFVKHAGATLWNHPLFTRWYTWFVPTVPITMYSELVGPGLVRVMTSLGNPLLWWSTSLAVLTCIWRGLRSVFQAGRLSGAMSGESYLVLCWVAPLAPWWISDRVTYTYHYLAVHTFGLIALGGVAALCLRRWYWPSIAFILLSIAVSIFYMPVWTKMIIPADSLPYWLWLPGWR